MNIHLPTILMFTRGTRVLTHCHTYSNYIAHKILTFSMGISGSQNGGTVPYKAICCGDIPFHRPYIGLIYSRYLQWIGSWNGHWSFTDSRVYWRPVTGRKFSPWCRKKRSLSIGRTLGLRIENRVITAFTKPEAGGKWDALKIVRINRVTAIDWFFKDVSTCFKSLKKKNPKRSLPWILTTLVGKLSYLTFRVLDVP